MNKRILATFSALSIVALLSFSNALSVSDEATKNCKEICKQVKKLAGTQVIKKTLQEIEKNLITPLSQENQEIVKNKLKNKSNTCSKTPVFPGKTTLEEQSANMLNRQMKSSLFGSVLKGSVVAEYYELLQKASKTNESLNTFKEKQNAVKGFYKTCMKLAKNSQEELQTKKTQAIELGSKQDYNNLTYAIAKLAEKRGACETETGTLDNKQYRMQKHNNLKAVEAGLNSALETLQK
ncbi:MAG: hypothetical protein UV38_C0002G0169 [candidate division TM6 bacterium GW2011_GWE2_42_60]|nr:MAG: hypothetical protein UV38_C0002G0169 [candidate division TM6 bacterium GW2011_GWE2_42_60]HBY06074.1 hypothetical protein [Candidatus Dependentiae bacterium]